MYIDPMKPIQLAPPFPGKGPLIVVKPLPEGKRHVTIHLTGQIGPASLYTEMYDELQNAVEGDEIVIMIDTPGGSVYTSQIIVMYMVASKATVTTWGSGMIASAGTIIWKHGHVKQLSSWAKFMFHGTSHGSMGNSDYIREEATYMVEYMKEMLKDMVVEGLLTREEYHKIVNSKGDVYVDAATMRKRLLGAVAATEGLRIFNAEGEEVKVEESDATGTPVPTADPVAPPDTTATPGTGDPTHVEPGAPQKDPVSPTTIEKNPDAPMNPNDPVVPPDAKCKKPKGEDDGEPDENDPEDPENPDECPCEDPNELEFECDKLGK